MKTAKFLTVICGLMIAAVAYAQKAKDLRPACDSMQVLMKERTSVTGTVRPKVVYRNGNTLDIRFSKELGQYPWRSSDIEWFKATLKTLLPDNAKGCSIRNITADGTKIETLVMPEAGNSGKPVSARFRTTDPRQVHPFIEEAGGQFFQKGLSGRNIALWQSHGRYYEEKTQRWEWQRAPLFQTVEDMYTQTYVLPFLIPMLENAGAYVMTPRERDTQTTEIIADNDTSFSTGRKPGMRIPGKYIETGKWSDAGTGFGDSKPFYVKRENPFQMGTARMASCHEKKGKAESTVEWVADFPERGRYSVYISYKTLPNSTTCAHYKVRHLGGTSDFFVNQKMGGGTWIYLGTFEFAKGSEGRVILDSEVPEGRSVAKNAVITADAVRFGGGMGKIARGQKDQDVSEYTTSGMPSFAEGAFYWMQWAGADSTLLNLHEDDYQSDYGDRGAWVGWMSGGSKVNPSETGLGIPVDMSFAFHTDAGLTPNDSIVGTLAIYTLKCDGSDKLPDGESRLQQRMYADFVQSQIVKDLRSTCNPQWSRREIWDKSYSESRTARVPAMLLELLSHQNFGDMKYGLDPSFRFIVSRAVYKGMLKYLSSRYGCEYAVQPLPVNSFATSFRKAPTAGQSAQIRLSWKPTVDTLETTASPTGYILYTRKDDGGFDNGEILSGYHQSAEGCTFDLSIPAGHIFSYRIVAYNDGGRSFPSETLSIGVPKTGSGKSVAVVNNFTRVSAPAWHDSPENAGFDNSVDRGVPYQREIGFIGDQYQFRRDVEWKDDDNPGFGGSYTDQAGRVLQGNTFDYTMIHGKAMIAAGYAYHSVSEAAFESSPSLVSSDLAADIICGKQITCPSGGNTSIRKYSVFPERLQAAIRNFTGKGGCILISGSEIGTDAWDSIYPGIADPSEQDKAKEFIQSVLGYKWLTSFASKKAEVWPMKNNAMDLAGKVGRMGYWNEKNDGIYEVETPDGLIPSCDRSHTILRYTDTNISAGTCFTGSNYKTVCIGFPLETLRKQEDLNALAARILTFFSTPAAE